MSFPHQIYHRNLLWKNQETKRTTDCRTSSEREAGILSVTGLILLAFASSRQQRITHSPPVALYRSVRALLVGVSLIQVAMALKNICDVFAEAIAAASICQSAIHRSQHLTSALRIPD